ncbi:pseudouridine synthase [Hypoxylon sp. NC0597]|nr:pseudouridine synthase [Hypoxylon sp. NC0597]
MRPLSYTCYSLRLSRPLGFIYTAFPREARRGFSTGLTAFRAKMDNESRYEKWTKSALIKRIQALEAELLRSGGHSQEIARGLTKRTAPEEGEATTAPDAVASPPKKKKAQRKIDPSKYSTRLVAFKLAYLGKRYGGFEFAAHASLPSIEEELWKAFVKACLIFPENPDEVNWDAWEYSKCGRTDRGVSAFGQVVVVRVRSNRPLPKPKKEQDIQEGEADDEGKGKQQDTASETGLVEEMEFNDFTDELPYCKMLNKLLPRDIRMLAWCPTTPPEFSARHDCRERQYRYFFTQPAFAPLPQSLENPETAKTTKVKGGWLDIEAMRVAAKKFEGAHDFRNFCKVDSSKLNMNFERKIFESDIVEVKDAETALPFLNRDEFRPASTSDVASHVGPGERLPKVYYFHVRGTAFLWHQIRCMVAIIFMVGQGLEDPSVIDILLDIEAEPRRPNYQLADETPLVLWDCILPRDDNPEKALNWVYLGEENPFNQHGVTGLVNGMWEYWRERKMDELLASQLLNIVASGADISLRKDAKAAPYIPATTRTFDGGNKERLVGKYQPLLKRERLPLPEEVFDREARRKGYADAADMREAFMKKKAEAAARAGKTPAEILALEEEVE